MLNFYLKTNVFERQPLSAQAFTDYSKSCNFHLFCPYVKQESSICHRTLDALHCFASVLQSNVFLF